MAAPEASDWDEARCAAALASLERLQSQLDDLRLGIPSILTPLKTLHQSPEAMFRDFKDSATAVSVALANFKNDWKSEDIQRLLHHARESEKNNPDLSQGVHVPKYGWVEAAQKLEQSQIKEGEALEKTTS
ncbi:uncharacterized protein J3D65DRAFT_350643 [Phyllosticta citribraziliensis]|uniref:Mediator complex subunit 10 n=1 Tax=Phyllosticta citribraziliensis TaxID=989973 RepID=A0ABR1LVY0_9PEZI